MTDFLLQITAFLVTVLALVSVHEAGHMVVARMLGIKVLRYSIGFGKIIWSHTSKAGIEYAISLLPLGGYVKLLDERETEVPPEERHLAFNNQPLYKRVLVVIAGPLTNIVFAILAYWLMFSIGFETLRPIIASVKSDTPAAMAKIQPDSVIVDIDGNEVETWQNAVLAIVKRMGEQSTMALITRPVDGEARTMHELNLAKWQPDQLNPDPLGSLGVLPYRPNVPAKIDQVLPDSPAKQAGLQAGDLIKSIDQKPVDNWRDLTMLLVNRPGKTVQVTYERAGAAHTTSLTIGARRVLSGLRKVGFIGVQVKPPVIPDYYKMEVSYSLLGAFKPAMRETFAFFTFNFVVLKKMFYGEISLKSLGGPITIFKTADTAFRQGVVVFLGFLALISVMLAFINVLPIPGLDGGHLLLYLVEAILRRPLSVQAEILVTRIGLVMILFLMFAATMNDLMRIFN